MANPRDKFALKALAMASGKQIHITHISAPTVLAASTIFCGYVLRSHDGPTGQPTAVLFA